MIELNGKYQSAKVFTDVIDEKSVSQIIDLLNQETFKDSVVRIMPDVHAGKGCVIGFTANLGECIIPNLIGVDIGCGMYTVNLGKEDINLEELDRFVRENIPYGFAVADKYPKGLSNEFVLSLEEISGRTKSAYTRNLKSIGSLGGGNHFIEISEDDEGSKYLVIHSGSRNFGLQIAKHHQEVAEKLLTNNENVRKDEREKLITSLKEQGKSSNIKEELLKLKKETSQVPRELAYLTGKEKDSYISDMKVAIEFASLSRKEMARKILDFLKISPVESFETIHNYLSEDGIIRKGAISANKDELVLIPINMKDGCIIARGKGNKDWNNSAPHGAGRLFSRSSAKESLSLDKFKEDMTGIYSSCISRRTLDECPEAYKPIESILENIKETVDVIKIIKPIYNFKG